MAYNPRLGAFAESAETRWGDPEHNLKNLIRYWMCDAFDNAVHGLRMNGELIAIQAQKKQRKTTLLANWIINFARQLPDDLWICIDTLESGMPPTRYSDTLIAILATKIMLMHVFGKDRTQWPSAEEIMDDPDIGKQLRLSADFFLYSTRTKFQKDAIDAAKILAQKMRISIFGPAKEEGQTRFLKQSLERWERLYEGTYPSLEGCQHRIFCVDNIQQIDKYAGDSYYGLEIITNQISSFLVTHPGTEGFAVCQETSTTGEIRGGSRMGEECNYVFDTSYDRDKSPLTMIVKNPYSRMTPAPTVIQELEPYSGAFLRLAQPAYGE